MRYYSFNPYKHSNIGGKLDYYQRNSPVSPVLARAQMNVRLRTSVVPNSNPTKYYIEFEVQPVMGLWNPHSVPLSARRYLFDWEVGANVKLKVGGRELSYSLYLLHKGANPWFRLQSESNSITFEPGEIRLFSADERKPFRQSVKLVTRWDEDGGFFVKLPANPPQKRNDPVTPYLEVSGSETVEVLEVSFTAPPERDGWSKDLYDLQKHNTFFAIKYGETIGGSSSSVEDSSTRMNNLWKSNDETGPKIVKDDIPPFRPTQHTTEPKHLATWNYYMRTSREDVRGQRNFIDSNVRAIVAKLSA